MKYIFATLLVASLILFNGASYTQAANIQYDLIPPQGQLSRGQDIQFIIEIDSGGSSVTSATVGMSYQSQYLQFVGATPGDAMSSVTFDSSQPEKLLFTGTNATGFNGKGVFAYVTFKIIASAPGEAQLCVLFQPTPTPQTPVSTPSATIPLPTRLPKTGSADKANMWTVAGLFCLIGATGTILALNRNKYSYQSPSPEHKNHG
jgi:LPXTG-motif cell wall-anchored protein